jgi:hypothetical protein
VRDPLLLKLSVAVVAPVLVRVTVCDDEPLPVTVDALLGDALGVGSWLELDDCVGVGVEMLVGVAVGDRDCDCVRDDVAEGSSAKVRRRMTLLLVSTCGEDG